MKPIFRYSIWLSVCVAAHFFIKVADAQVVINEVFPNPSDGLEWIELFNNTANPISLAGWKLSDQLTTPSTVYTWSEATLNPLDYLVVELTSQKLNNSADGVVLTNNLDITVDQMNYSSSQPTLSWARQPNGAGSFVLNNPSKGTENPNPIPTPSPSPIASPTPSPSPSPSPIDRSWFSKIEIKQVLPCPMTGEHEWVELNNQDSASHTLTDWSFSDESNQVRNFTLTIEAQSSARLTWSSSWLNNSGDELILLDSSEQSVDVISFDDCQKGVPISKNIVQASKITDASTQNASTSATSSTVSPLPTPTLSSTKSTQKHTLKTSASEIVTSSPSPPYSTPFLRPGTTTIIGATVSIVALSSVILGGLILFCLGSYYTYRAHQTTQVLS